MMFQSTEGWLAREAARLAFDLRLCHFPENDQPRVNWRRNAATDGIVVAVEGLEFEIPRALLNYATPAAARDALMTRVLLPVFLPYGY